MSDTEADTVGVAELYRHTTQEIRWGKQQQWQLTYYAVLLFGAIHLLYKLARDEFPLSVPYLSFGASTLSALSLLIGALIVARFQAFLVKGRCILLAIYAAKNGDIPQFVTKGFRQIRGRDDLGVGFMADWNVWISVLFLLAVAAASVQFRAYADQWQCLIAWGVTDLALIGAAVVYGYFEASTEQHRDRTPR